MDQLRRTVHVPFCPETPTDRQLAFLMLGCREAFYGGAAGGGKSSALLMGALQYVETPGYTALILRKNYADLALPGAIMDRCNDWLRGTAARSVGGGKEWHFPSGASLTFGYLDKPSDRFRYQGAAFNYVAFDEVTQFWEREYRYLFSRLRRAKGTAIPSRMRSAGNPDGVGFDWVRARLVDGPNPYIPARLEDNPFLDQDDYKQSLDELDPVTRRRLLLGDWTARGGGEFFQRGWFALTRSPGRTRGRTVRAWDLAATDPKSLLSGKDPDWTAGVLLREFGGHYWVEDIRRFRKRPGEVEAEIAQTAANDPEGTVVWIEQEPGASGKSLVSHYRRNVLPGYAVRALRQTGPKDARIKVVSSRAEGGDIDLVPGAWVPAFLDEAEPWPESSHDDQLDALSTALMAMARTPDSGGDVHREEEAASRSDPLSHMGDRL